MTTSQFDWPTKKDYDEAMLSLSRKIFDPDISKGKLITSQSGRIASPGGANLYVCLYRIDGWIIRCFCRTDKKAPPPNITKRYEHISTFCQSHSMSVPALLPITYMQKGIEIDIIDRDSYVLVKTATLPLVKMPFVQASSLGRFIAAHHKNTARMQQLADAWFHMIQTLENANIAHGDLDLTNILVEQQGTRLTLKLIDYDNMWLPELANLEQTEYGHEPFQHPTFQPPHRRPYNAEMDRFSALVIYLSIKALATRPQLYQRWGADDTNRLLFTKKDYIAETQNDTGHIIELQNLRIPSLDPYIQELRSCLHRREMPRSLTAIAPVGNSIEHCIEDKNIECRVEDRSIEPRREAISPSEVLPTIDEKWMWDDVKVFVDRNKPLIDIEEYKQKQANIHHRSPSLQSTEQQIPPLSSTILPIIPTTLPPTEPASQPNNTPVVPTGRQRRIRPSMVLLFVVIFIVIVAAIIVILSVITNQHSSSQNTSYIFLIHPSVILSLSNHTLLLLAKSI